MFPKSLFPSKLSILGYVVFIVSLLWLISTIGILPQVLSQVGREFTQPRGLNAIFLATFLAGLTLYALERHTRGE